ncbi:DNA-directed RNA polymerase subunit beta', partial [Candidatus Roizmanbacteria bacterium CG_4_8_14_3_um_filter_34_9]
MEDINTVDFSGLRITFASPDTIIKWSHGEVVKPETINYRTFRAEKDGLFDERIFGPTKDYECYCGKYKRMRYKGIVCDRCGVEITTSAVRRERMGHIKLASPIAHIWYFKGTSSTLSIILDVPPQALERVIYYALYLVKEVDKEKQKNTLKTIDELQKVELKTIEDDFVIKEQEINVNFEKQYAQLEKKISHREQLEIAKQEVEFKKREQLKLLSNEQTDTKVKKSAYFERVAKIARSIRPFDVIEEDDYLFFRDNNIADFLNVGMGSEVLYEILSNFDLNKNYAQTLELLNESKGEKRNKLLKKARVLEAFIKAKIDPKWIILTVLPVIPPDLRPVVQLPGGKFATSDLNDFYRRVINRNNRLKQLIDLGAPEIILRNEKRMLQEAVDSLIDLQKSRGKTRTGANTKVQKSLSDILRGKQGRFRQNLLGKRVDYSGRSTIVVGPELKLNQCGLPREMALELFKPYLLHEIIIRGLAPNIKSAKLFLEKKDPVVYDILEVITKDHPVLLNRAPTLHKLSILGFYPVLNDDYAIKLHPAVCSGFNADFDGDAMGVFLPLSKMAIEEVKQRMFAYHNLLKPSDGSPIVLPNKEMALGCYYLTTIDSHMEVENPEDLKFFATENEAMRFQAIGKIKLRQPINVGINGKIIKTTVGRIIFNQALPPELKFVNTEVKASDLKNIVVSAMKIFENEKVGDLIDRIKELGFWASTIAGGLSLSVFDCQIIPEKNKVIKEAEKEIEKITKNFEQGLLTAEEKKRYSNKLWIDVTENLANKTWNALDEENPVKIIIKSGGARASKEQLKQLAAMKGLVVDPMGKIIEVPTKSNYRQGLSIFEYVISARGARKGLTDSALKTADAGYLTRRLVDTSHDMIVREEDCLVKEGLTISTTMSRGEKFKERIKNRFILNDLVNEKGEVLIKANELITNETIELIEKNKIAKITVRSPLYCASPYGVCQKCYG